MCSLTPLLVPERYPLQQGLKQEGYLFEGIKPEVPERYPLQQGLKHRRRDSMRVVVLLVPERYPLQQGLKQKWCEAAHIETGSSGAISTTTRIETVNRSVSEVIPNGSGAISTTTRIETLRKID